MLNTKHVDDRKNKKVLRKEKAYVAWDDSASTSTNASSRNEEEVNIYLLVDQDSEIENVSDSNFAVHSNCYQLLYIFSEIYEEVKKTNFFKQ